MRRWFEIYVKDEYYDAVYDEQDIIKLSCDLVNGAGVNPDDIKVVTKGEGIESLCILYVCGDTYDIKEELKADGFKWDAQDKVWYKNFNLNEEGIGVEYVKHLAEAMETTDGVWCEVKY